MTTPGDLPHVLPDRTTMTTTTTNGPTTTTSPPTIRALTLTQPWATLVANGSKRIETRSWADRHRGPLLIHAAKGLGNVGGKRGLHALTHTEPFLTALHDDLLAGDLPLGAIVATATVHRIVLMTEDNVAALADREPREHAFGHYAPGRYGWELRDVHRFPTPIPCRGALGLWTPPRDARDALPTP